MVFSFVVDLVQKKTVKTLHTYEVCASFPWWSWRWYHIVYPSYFKREREGKKRGRKRKDIIMAGVPVTFIKYVSILSRREIFIWIQRATLFYVLSLIPVGCVVVSVVVVFWLDSLSGFLLLVIYTMYYYL